MGKLQGTPSRSPLVEGLGPGRDVRSRSTGPLSPRGREVLQRKRPVECRGGEKPEGVNGRGQVNSPKPCPFLLIPGPKHPVGRISLEKDGKKELGDLSAEIRYRRLEGSAGTLQSLLLVSLPVLGSLL